MNDSALSINANEFVPSFPVSEAVNTQNVVEHEPHLEPEFEPHHTSSDHNQAMELHETAHGESLLAVDPPTANSIEETVAYQHIESEIAVAPAAEAEPQSVIASSICGDTDAVTNAAAAVATAAVAGVAAVGIVKAASPKAKPTDTKKVDSKVKAAPIKKTAPTTVTSKVAAARTSASKIDDKLKTATSKVASRTVPPKVGSTADKKSTVTSTVPRKPASNGSKYHSVPNLYRKETNRNQSIKCSVNSFLS